MKRQLNNDCGMALFVVLVMLVVLMTIAGASSMFTSMSARTTANTRDGTVAFHTADAGINHAVRELANGDGTNDFSTIYAAGSGTQIVSNNSFNGGSYVVTQEGTASSPSRVKIRSVSTSANGSTAQIEAWVQSTSGCGICASGDVSMTGGSTIDSYDSSKGAYNAALGGGVFNKGSNGNVSSNGNISLSGSGTTIYGDATATGTVSGSVTGTKTTGAAPQTYTPVGACGPPYSSGTGITGGSYNSSTGALSTGSHEALTFAPGTYCLSSISLGSHSTLTVSGATTINLTADTDLSGGDIVNPGNPANLAINSSSTAGLKVNGGANASMTINCPKCAVTINGGGSFYGSITAGSFTASGGALLHYDTKLGANSIKMYSWVQTF
jgi:Tfp pilus assembly protein PilX